MLALTLLSLIPLLVPASALTVRTRAADPVPADLTHLSNGARMARGLPLRKPVARDEGARLRARQATPSGTVGTLSVCGNYQASDFGQSCTAAANPAGPGGTCCTDSPGGLMLLTQFWDSGAASAGPANSWTLHGLWPDNCDSTYEEYCDPSRERSAIRSILTNNGQTALVSYMDTYWKSNNNNDESFWAHEWNKHGTCISSLDKACYTAPRENGELITYFQRSVSTFQSLPSYDWLAADGIIPTNNATYTSDQILSALTKSYGFTPVIRCQSGSLSEVWYFYNSKGGIVDGSLVKTGAVGDSSNCPATGIRYLPKYTVNPNPPSIVPAIIGAPPSAAGVRGFVYPTYSDGSREDRACLIRVGVWFKGTCAGYTSVTPPAGSPAGSFQLQTGGGLCGILAADNRFSCAASFTAATAAVFQFNAEGEMSIMGQEAFGSTKVPGTDQVPVYLGPAQAVDYSLVFVPQ